MFISIDDAVIFKANNYSHRFNKRRVLETHFTMKLDLIQYFVVCRKKYEAIIYTTFSHYTVNLFEGVLSVLRV